MKLIVNEKDGSFESINAECTPTEAFIILHAMQRGDAIDKIRSEIEIHCGLIKENHCKYCSYCNSVMGVREILEIIDKYKVEESDKE